MKKILLSLAAAGALAAAAAPAAAQPWRDYGPDGRWDGYHQPHGGQLTTAYVDSLDWKIRNAAREGRISWSEARDLRGEFRDVQPIAWRVETGQANRWEATRLRRAVDHIEWAVNRNDGGYGYGYGQGWRR